MLLPTSLVGSYAQPDWLIDKEKLAGRFPPRVRATELWRVDEQYREEAFDDATLLAIRDQEKAGLEGAAFSVCDCTNEIDVESLLTQAHETVDSKTTNIVVYTRFFLHSIDKTQEQQFVIALGKSMIQGDKLYFEFRCELDEALSKVYGKDHYRRYVKTSEFVDFLKTIGFEIEYEMTGQSMAKYKSEDPFVI